MNRRNFWKTVTVLGLSILAPVGKLFGYCNWPKLIINGVEIPLPNKLDIVLDIPQYCQEMSYIHVLIRGNKLTINNPSGPALLVERENGGCLEFIGTEAVFIRNKDKNGSVIILTGNKNNSY